MDGSVTDAKSPLDRLCKAVPHGFRLRTEEGDRRDCLSRASRLWTVASLILVIVANVPACATADSATEISSAGNSVTGKNSVRPDQNGLAVAVPTEHDPPDEVLEQFLKADTDRNGLVSLSELMAAFPEEQPKSLKKQFARGDENRDGQLSAEEFETATRSPSLLYWFMGLFSVVSFFGSLALLPVIVARIPADYFVTHQQPARWTGIGPWEQARLIIRNTLGLILIIAGIAALFLPGQGMLMILLGIVLSDLPFKWTLILKIVRRPRIFTALNWIRRKAGQPPLQIPPDLATQNPPEPAT